MARVRARGDMLVVEGEMTITEASSLKDQLLEHIPLEGDIRLDLSGVDEMDSSGFQLLEMARSMAEKRSAGFTILAHSRATIEVIDAFRATAAFGPDRRN